MLLRGTVPSSSGKFINLESLDLLVHALTGTLPTDGRGGNFQVDFSDSPTTTYLVFFDLTIIKGWTSTGRYVFNCFGDPPLDHVAMRKQALPGLQRNHRD